MSGTCLNEMFEQGGPSIGPMFIHMNMFAFFIVAHIFVYMLILGILRVNI